MVGLPTGCRRGNALVIAVQRCASYHSNIDPLVLHSIDDHSTLDLHSTLNALCSTYRDISEKSLPPHCGCCHPVAACCRRPIATAAATSPRPLPPRRRPPPPLCCRLTAAAACHLLVACRLSTACQLGAVFASHQEC